MPNNLGLYLIDTCALVNVRDLHNDSEEIWTAIRVEITGGRLKTVRQVFEELERRFPKIHARLKDLRRDFLLPDGELYAIEVVVEIRNIQQNHPKLYDGLAGGNPADPFLIAAAKLKSAIVVTDEKTEGPGYKSKIPFVCTNRNVGCTNRIGYLRLLGF